MSSEFANRIEKERTEDQIDRKKCQADGRGWAMASAAAEIEIEGRDRNSR